MKLFSTGKTGVFLDDYKAKTEKRKSGEVEALELSFRIQPFSSQHALALPNGERVKSALFERTTGDPVAYLRDALLSLPVTRQQLTIYATPETEKSAIVLDQVLIARLRAHIEKNVDGYSFTFKATFAHSNKQLIFVDDHRKKQIFVSCEEAEPDLDIVDADADDEEEEDDDEGQGTLLGDEVAERPAPMFDDPRDEAPAFPQSVGAAAAKPERAQRRMHSHAGGKKKGAKKRR